MLIKQSIGAFVLIVSMTASAFEIKGLQPSMTVSELQKQLPQAVCEEWLSGPYAQKCDVENPTGKYRTVADQLVNSIRALADDKGIIHTINFQIVCGVLTERLAEAFEAKFGKANEPEGLNSFYKLNNSFRWRDKGEEMVLSPQNGKNGVCHAVYIQDKVAIDWLDKPVKTSPSKDL